MSQEVTTQGVEADKEEILRLHRQWYEANHGLNIPKMQEFFPRTGDDYLMYNLNGHPYYGLAEKTRLWEHYSKEIEVTDPLEVKIDRVDIVGDMAYVACEGVFPVRAIGAQGNGGSNLALTSEPILFRFRSTEVYKRDDGEGNAVWKMWHFHCSPLPPVDEVRPGFDDTYESRS